MQKLEKQKGKEKKKKKSVSGASIELVSALEDHIPGFSANWTSAASGQAAGAYPMSRLADDQSYAGVIGPKISSKSYLS